MNENLEGLVGRIKSDRKLLLIVILGIAGIILLTLSELMPEKNENEAAKETSPDISEYEQETERRLAELISSIDGAGRTRVMITLSSGDENVYATEDKSGKENYERSYVVVKQSGDENGMLLRVNEPEIRGAAIVCEGADSERVKQEIINTVTAVLGIGTNRINIAKMKKSDGG